ncbi:MAG: LuxR family transcriptional regulator [Phoenicibacter congonensis]|uniref:LuxR family transcriptional regulator n=1 Tax=Phoenicibacter congonensis TaxID=1944646 RepID=A0AA43U8Q9_9ACTN|nr:LuxR family transcriptional regulator [Phoenicibacter congonensis]
MSKHKMKSYEALLALALFFFVLLECSSYYGIALGRTGLDLGLAKQIPSLTANAIGFVSFSFITKRTTEKARKTIAIVGSVIGAASVLYTLVATNPIIIETLKVVTFFLLGYVAAGVHASTAKLFVRSKHLSLSVGVAHAAGLTLQFVTFLLVPFGIIKALLIIAAVGGLVVFDYRSWEASKSIDFAAIKSKLAQKSYSEEMPNGKINDFDEIVVEQPKKLAGYIIALVALFAFLFNSLYGASSQDSQSFSPFILLDSRVVLAVSGIIAGYLFDFKRGRYAGLAMISVAFVALAAILGVEAGGDPNIGRAVFFLADGFFVVFYTSAFLGLAPHMDDPDLWAGMGRTIANVCAIPTSIPAVLFVETGNIVALTVLLLPTLGITIFFLVKAGMLSFHDPKTNENYILRPSDAFGPRTNATAAQANGSSTATEVHNRNPLQPAGNLSTATTAHTESAQATDEVPGKEKANGFAYSLTDSENGEQAPACNKPNRATSAATTIPTANAPAALTPEEKLQMFAQKYDLTERESEILGAVTASEKTLKATAAGMGISLRTVQHHLTSIYKKTNTQTRTGLTRCFSEFPEN